LQAEQKVLSTQTKLDLVACLVRSGLRHIQVASFVHPRRVPQMADAEDLIHSLPRPDGVEYSGLVLNRTGLDRALRTPLHRVEISVSASDTHSRKNAGMSRKEALEQAVAMIARARAEGVMVRGSVQCALGCGYEGPIDGTVVGETAQAMAEAGADALVLADTTGKGGPAQLRAVISRTAGRISGLPLGLHLHDTLGLGLVNVMTGLECGIRSFDTSCGGIGGCPFVPGAAGNIATEDTVHLLDQLGYASGVDWAEAAGCTRMLETILDRRLPAKLRPELFGLEGAPGCQRSR
jgi:hydroxymethylglutaryl-CoA lyase